MFSGLSGIFAAYFEFKLFQHKDQIFYGFFGKKEKFNKAVDIIQLKQITPAPI